MTHFTLQLNKEKGDVIQHPLDRDLYSAEQNDRSNIKKVAQAIKMARTIKPVPSKLDVMLNSIQHRSIR